MTGRTAARARLVVFLRYPEPGQVKTRLIPALGPDGAARLYTRLARHTLEQAARLRLDGLERRALVTPAERVAEARRLFGGPFTWRAQQEGSLGERMARAFDEAFGAGAREVVLIGSDCPGLSSRHLAEAFEQLAHHDAVLGPAVDGGYWLVGLSRPLPMIFERVPWSSPETLAATRRRLRVAAASWIELSPLRDLDTPADLEALESGD